MKGNFFKDPNMMCRFRIASKILIVGGSAAYTVHQTVKFIKTITTANLAVQAIAEAFEASRERVVQGRTCKPCRKSYEACMNVGKISCEPCRDSYEACMNVGKMSSFGHRAERIALGFLILCAILAVNNTVVTYKPDKGAPPFSGSSKTT